MSSIVFICSCKKQVEFGIGIGYIQYSYAQNDYNQQFNTWQRMISFTRLKDENMFYLNDSFKQNMTYPAFYIGFRLHKRLEARFSLQVARAKASFTLNDIYTSTEKHVDAKYSAYDLSFGYYYTLVQQKRFEIATGIGFWLYSTKTVNSYTYTPQIIEKYTVIDGAFMPFFAISSSIALYKNVSLKYDMSAMTDFSSYHIRPISRLSLNYFL